MKKILFPLIGILFFIIGLFLSYGLVFGNNLVPAKTAQLVGTLGEDIYLDDAQLNSLIVVYKADGYLGNFSVSSTCPIKSEYLEEYKGLSFFRVTYIDPNCLSGNIILSSGGNTLQSSLKSLPLSTKISQLEDYMDTNSNTLKSLQLALMSQVNTYAAYRNAQTDWNIENIKYIFGKRIYTEAQLKLDMIDRILAARSEKYLVPVEGREIDLSAARVPNAGRPYRAEYTDGIHHGWDIPGPEGDSAIALDDGIVVRVVRGFEWSDFSNIVYGDNLSEEQELKNLDILRGNQVWIKTMKGDVAFYSHLSSIPENITE